MLMRSLKVRASGMCKHMSVVKHSLAMRRKGYMSVVNNRLNMSPVLYWTIITSTDCGVVERSCNGASSYVRRRTESDVILLFRYNAHIWRSEVNKADIPLE